MKNLYKYLTWAALPLAFTACQDEIANDNSTVQNKDMYTLRCVVNNDPQSRAQIKLGNTAIESEYCYWNNGDQLTVYDHADIDESTTIESPVTNLFTIDSAYDENNPSNTANFIGASPLTDGHTITAIYPAQKVQGLPIENGCIKLSITGNRGAAVETTEEGWKKYMNNNMFMYSTVQVNGTNTSLHFNHLYSMVRITYTNATDTVQKLVSLDLNGNKLYFGTEVSFNIKTGETILSGSTSSVSHQLSDLTVAPGESYDIYGMFFPRRDVFSEDSYLYIQLNYNGLLKTPDLPTSLISAANGGANYFEAGKRYWFNVTQTNEGLVWTKDIEVERITNLELIQAIEESAGITFEKDADGFVEVEANRELIDGITTYLNLNNKGLTSLEGIEYFQNLKNLWCSDNQLEHVDLSKNVNLLTFECTNNLLTELDVTQNKALINLSCQDNAISTLDVSNNKMLETLQCDRNPLTSLDVSKNNNLNILHCGECNLSSLNISANTILEDLFCGWQHNLEGTGYTILELTINQSQKEIWDNNWDNINNNYVTPIVTVE